MNRTAWLCSALMAVAAGCKTESPVAAEAGAAASAPAPRARPPSPGCDSFGERTARVAGLLQEGRLDRAARVMARAAELCPERAAEVWPQLAETYGALGDVEALASLAATAGQAGPAASEAIARARASTSIAHADAGDHPQARRQARKLFAQAILEPKPDKARDLFLQAAAMLPPAGPALVQAARAAARAGDKVEAQKLFDRALTALRRTTHQQPVLDINGPWGAVRHLETDTAGRLVMAAADHSTFVLDAIGWRARFEFDATPGDAAMSRDGTVVVFSGPKALTSCSLLEATCVSVVVDGDVGDVAMAPDGERVAAVLRSGTVVIVDAATLQTVQTIAAPGGATTLGWAPSGERLWLGLGHGGVAGVNPMTGAIEVTRAGHKGPVRAVAAHGQVLATADAKTLRVGGADGADSEELGTFEGADHDPIAGLAVSPDGRTVLVERDRGLELWSVPDRKRVGEALGANSGNVSCPRVATSAGRYYVANTLTGTAPWIRRFFEIQPFQVAAPEALKSAEPLSQGVSWDDGSVPAIQFLGAGGTLATVDDLCTTTLWDVDKGQFLRTTRKFQAFRNCRGLVLSADGKGLMGTNDHRSVTRVEVASSAESIVPGELEKLLRNTAPGAPQDAMHAVQAAGALVWVDGKLSIHAGRSPGPYRVVGKQRAPASDADHRVPDPWPALSPNGERGAWCKDAHTVVVFEIAQDASREIAKPNVSGMAFGSDGALFVSSLDGSILVFRGEGEPSTILAPRGGILYGLASAGGGRFIAGAMQGGPVFVWSASDSALLATLLPVGEGALALAPDGSAELFNKAEAVVDCRFGPFVFGLELCRERLVNKGVLARALAGHAEEP